MLSSDPEYPVELRIAPLSYELNASSLGQSCWSCEGHADAHGELCRSPRVWFYAEAAVAIDLIAEHIQLLQGRKMLSHTWQVIALSPIAGTVDCPVFSLEPVIKQELSTEAPLTSAQPDGELGELRQDLRLIATSLGHRVRALASRQLKNIRRELATLPTA